MTNSKETDNQSRVSEPDMAGTYTAADYLKWTMDELVELVKGKIVKMSPSPTSAHQKISLEIVGQLFPYFKKSACQLYEAPLDVYLTNDPANYKKAENVFQPDIFTVCDPEKMKSFGCTGAPDLVMEITSPSTSKKDIKDKREIYEAFGVKEYWMFFPPTKSALRLNLENGQYHTYGPFAESDTPHSLIFPDLQLDLQEIFREVEITDY